MTVRFLNRLVSTLADWLFHLNYDRKRWNADEWARTDQFPRRTVEQNSERMQAIRKARMN